ncbi:MAG: RhsIA family immunity protein, partial [Gemmatimonadota bacterium]|nr:RhsIA family immunity protein [Gemmatimonadota bacterium]
TWLWAWGHPSVQPPLSTHARRMREYGETNRICELTTRKLVSTEEQCWQFTALACKLNEAQGAYRGPAGSALVFMTFGEPKLTGTVEQDAVASTVEPDDTAFTSDIPPAVRAKLRGFIQALHDWEVAAYQTSERNDSLAAMNMAKETYAALIREWCVPDLTPQPMSYGSDPNHGPDTEQLVSAAIVGDLCRVRTQHTNSTGFASDYEYHLRLIGGDWLTEQLYYVDQGEKYEML